MKYDANELTARDILKMEYGSSPNFMTPTVLRRGKIRSHIAYEISKGSGISGGTIYGLSLVEYDCNTDKTKRLTDKSGCFHSRASLERRLDELRDELH